MSYRPISNSGEEQGVRIIQYDFDEYVYNGVDQNIANYPIDINALNLQEGDAYEVNIWGEFAANTNSKAVSIYNEDYGVTWADTGTISTTATGYRGWKTILRITKFDATYYISCAKARTEHVQGHLYVFKDNQPGPLNSTLNVSIRAIGGAPAAGDITVKGMTLTILRA
tara:strand:- start:583 stop:1089 length:507 start_codon:yes stop_codon:yes gene_type:complete